MRRSELARLELDDVDLDGRRILIRKSQEPQPRVQSSSPTRRVAALLKYLRFHVHRNHAELPGPVDRAEGCADFRRNPRGDRANHEGCWRQRVGSPVPSLDGEPTAQRWHVSGECAASGRLGEPGHGVPVHAWPKSWPRPSFVACTHRPAAVLAASRLTPRTPQLRSDSPRRANPEQPQTRSLVLTVPLATAPQHGWRDVDGAARARSLYQVLRSGTRRRHAYNNSLYASQLRLY